MIAIFETAGDRLAYRDNGSTKDIRFYNAAVWEDDTHVLFTLFQDGKWSMVRMGVDGADGARSPASGRGARGSALALRDALSQPLVEEGRSPVTKPGDRRDRLFRHRVS